MPCFREPKIWSLGAEPSPLLMGQKSQWISTEVPVTRVQCLYCAPLALGTGMGFWHPAVPCSW